jgi:hypothetical protein
VVLIAEIPYNIEGYAMFFAKSTKGNREPLIKHFQLCKLHQIFESAPRSDKQA